MPSYRPTSPPGVIPSKTRPISPDPDTLTDHVIRQTELTQLLAWITPEAEHSDQPFCVLSGPAGMGKSTLVHQLSQHDDVIHAFGKRIFWLHAGANPTDLPDQVNEIGFEHIDTWTFEADPKQAIQKLFDRLSKERMLLIVDDVGTVEQALQFLPKNDQAKVLIITRNKRIAKAFDAPEFEIAELTEQEAREVCTNHGTSIPDILCTRKVTRTPLILHLCHLCLARRITIPKPDDSFTFEEYLAQLWGLLLGHYAKPYRDSINMLGIFPALTPLSYPVISNFWRKKNVHINDQELFDELKLLRILSHRTHSNTAVVSDLFQHFVDTRLEVGIPKLHKAFLDVYSPESILSGDTNFDEYIYRFLPHHIVSANKTDTLFKLLLSEQWISTKIQQTDVSALRLDYTYGRSDITIRLIDEAIRLATATLETDRQQIISQLISRLLAVDIPAVSDLVDDLRSYRSSESVWLDPSHVDLRAPSSTLSLTLEGHQAEVLSIDVDYTRNRAISSSSDRAIYVWDLKKKKPIHKLNSFPVAADKVILFSKGKEAITVSAHVVTHWDLKKGKEIKRHLFHSTPVLSIYLFPNETNVMSADEGGNIFFWNLKTGDIQGNLRPGQEAPWAIASTNRRPLAFTAGNNEIIQAWDLNTGKLRFSLTGHEDWIWAICVTKDDRYLISASEDHSIIIWDLDEAKVVRVLKGHKAGVRFLSLAADDTMVLSADAEQSIILWDLKTGDILRSFTGLTNWIHGFKALPTGEAAFLATDEPDIKLWSMAEDMLPGKEAPSHDKGIRALLLAPGDIQLISASDDATIRKWQTNTASLVDSYTGHTDWISSICLSRGGSILVSTSFDKTVRVWDLDEGHCRRILEGHLDWVWCAAISDNSKYVVSGSEDRTIITWDMQNGAIKHVLTAHDDAVNKVLISADNRHIISSSLDRTMCVWDEQSGSLLNVLEGHTDRIRSITLSPIGDRLVSGSDDSTIRVWNFLHGIEDECMTNPGGAVKNVYLLPNGYHLLSVSEDHKLRVWDLVLNKPVYTLSNHTDEITHLAVSKSGRYAATTSSDRMMCLWDVEHGHLVDSYYADYPMTYCIFSADSQRLIGADSGGGLHFFHVRGGGF